jgi:hypothetical protein
MRHTIIFILLSCIFSGCSSSPEDKIIGSWQFDRIERNPNLPQVDATYDALLQDVYAGVRYVFRKDGTSEVFSGMAIDSETGTYHLENNGAVLVTETSGGYEQRTTLLKLTNDEMWFDSGDGSALVFRKE